MLSLDFPWCYNFDGLEIYFYSISKQQIKSFEQIYFLVKSKTLNVNIKSLDTRTICAGHLPSYVCILKYLLMRKNCGQILFAQSNI